MPAYYDYLLAAIPVALLGAPVALLPFGLPFTTGITIGAALSMGFVVHGLFVNSPTDTHPVHTVKSANHPPQDTSRTSINGGQHTMTVDQPQPSPATPSPAGSQIDAQQTSITSPGNSV